MVMKKSWMFALLAGWFSPVALSSQESAKLVVATYNLRYHNPKDGINAWPNRVPLVIGLIRFHEWDLFGTQEVLYDQIQDLASMSEFAYVGVGRDDGKLAGEFAALYYRKSRIEILESGSFWFSPTPEQPTMGWDARCCKRICTWAACRDKQNNRIFYVFNAHFDHEGVVARLESARLMHQKVVEISKGQPVILMGDFNSLPESDAVKVLTDAGYRDSYRHTREIPYGPAGTFNGFNWNAALDQRIDYIFLGASFSVLKYGVLTDSFERRYPSDHLPVQVELSW
jgi:endonuclease/exonuclease/phosphatase family metal-dependent hydrolase